VATPSAAWVERGRWVRKSRDPIVFSRDADKADGDCIFAAAQRGVDVEGRAGVNPKPAFAEDGLDVCPVHQERIVSSPTDLSRSTLSTMSPLSRQSSS
jgi:hypothetical protein